MAARTIIAVGCGVRREYKAASTISPGDLVVINSSGLAARNSVAASNAVRTFAIENEIFGKGVDSDYVAGDRVLVEDCDGGMEVNASVAANAPAIAIGDPVESAGDGTVRKVALTTGAGVIGYADEALDNSANASKARVRIRLV